MTSRRQRARRRVVKCSGRQRTAGLEGQLNLATLDRNLRKADGKNRVSLYLY